MVRAFSSLCGSLFLLWQHYQTCKALWIFLFHMACTVYQVHRLILCLSPLGSILRISQSPLHSRLQHVACVSDYSHGYSLQVQVSFLSIHPSIHPFLIHLQTSFTPATLSSRLACPENLQRCPIWTQMPRPLQLAPFKHRKAAVLLWAPFRCPSSSLISKTLLKAFWSPLGSWWQMLQMIADVLVSARFLRTHPWRLYITMHQLCTLGSEFQADFKEV